MASRVYDELYAVHGRMPTEEEVSLRPEQKLGRERATASAEDVTSSTYAASRQSPPLWAQCSGPCHMPQTSG